jgi:C-terminal processing protease CtpA/Prc
MYSVIQYSTILCHSPTGDEIVGINGKSLEGMSHKESKSLLHAEPGDTKPVKLTIVKNSLETKGL